MNGAEEDDEDADECEEDDEDEPDEEEQQFPHDPIPEVEAANPSAVDAPVVTNSASPN